jgi:hypothetical protein
MIAAVFWIAFWVGIWPLAAWLIDRSIHPRTPERRVARLLAWYPAGWRERHGAALGELLAEAIADGRDGPRTTFDVARAGLGERVALLRREPLETAFLIGVGWLMFMPQGIVAGLLTQLDVPRSWFLALYVDGQAQFLVAGAMAGIGLLVLERGLRRGRALCVAR